MKPDTATPGKLGRGVRFWRARRSAKVSGSRLHYQVLYNSSILYFLVFVRINVDAFWFNLVLVFQIFYLDMRTLLGKQVNITNECRVIFGWLSSSKIVRDIFKIPIFLSFIYFILLIFLHKYFGKNKQKWMESLVTFSNFWSYNA